MNSFNLVNINDRVIFNALFIKLFNSTNKIKNFIRSIHNNCFIDKINFMLEYINNDSLVN
jgi:hypothetical protein